MDEYPSYVLIIILVILIVLSMLFSISESAFLGMNKLRLRILRKNKNKRAQTAGKLLERKEHLINSLLVSNDLVNILLSSILTAVALEIFGEKGVGIATLAATVLLLIFGEITPKTISTRCPDKIAYALAPFVKFITIIMFPIVVVVTFISRVFLRFFGIKTKQKKQSYTEEEIKTFFDMSTESGIIDKNENKMMSQVFKFSDLEAQNIMVPRTRIRAVSENATYFDIVEASQRFGFTRFPVFRKSIDDIIGIIYIKDLLRFKENPESFEIKKVMKPPIFILGTKKMSELQEILFENHQAMAIVVDEYSGTDGIVTEKDITREIFAFGEEVTLRGKVFDYDEIENKTDFEVNGSVLLRDLKQELHVNFESEINETLGGWLCVKLDRMPENNDCVLFEGWNFKIKKMLNRHVETVQIKKIVNDESEGDKDYE